MAGGPWAAALKWGGRAVASAGIVDKLNDWFLQNDRQDASRENTERSIAATERAAREHREFIGSQRLEERGLAAQQQQRGREYELQDRRYSEQRYAQITSPENAARLGQAAKAYYDEAHPGTNAWERLGSSNPSGQVAVAEQANEGRQRSQNISNRGGLQQSALQARTNLTQSDIQARTALAQSQIQARTQHDVTRMNNQTAIRQSLIQAGASAGQSIYATRTAANTADKDRTIKAGQLEVNQNQLQVNQEVAKFTNQHTAALTASEKERVKEIITKTANINEQSKHIIAQMAHEIVKMGKTATEAEIQKIILYYADLSKPAGLAVTVGTLGGLTYKAWRVLKDWFNIKKMDNRLKLKTKAGHEPFTVRNIGKNQNYGKAP